MNHKKGAFAPRRTALPSAPSAISFCGRMASRSGSENGALGQFRECCIGRGGDVYPLRALSASRFCDGITLRSVGTSSFWAAQRTPGAKAGDRRPLRTVRRPCFVAADLAVCRKNRSGRTAWSEQRGREGSGCGRCESAGFGQLRRRSPKRAAGVFILW